MGNESDAYYVKQSLLEIYAIIGYAQGLSHEEFMG